MTWKCDFCGVQMDGTLPDKVTDRRVHYPKSPTRTARAVLSTCGSGNCVIESLKWKPREDQPSSHPLDA